LILIVIILLQILNIVDLTGSILDLKEVGIHGGVSGTNVVWHG
jgi:hypothetical protein